MSKRSFRVKSITGLRKVSRRRWSQPQPGIVRIGKLAMDIKRLARGCCPTSGKVSVTAARSISGRALQKSDVLLEKFGVLEEHHAVGGFALERPRNR